MQFNEQLTRGIELLENEVDRADSFDAYLRWVMAVTERQDHRLHKKLCSAANLVDPVDVALGVDMYSEYDTAFYCGSLLSLRALAHMSEPRILSALSDNLANFDPQVRQVRGGNPSDEAITTATGLARCIMEDGQRGYRQYAEGTFIEGATERICDDLEDLTAAVYVQSGAGYVLYNAINQWNLMQRADMERELEDLAALRDPLTIPVDWH